MASQPPGDLTVRIDGARAITRLFWLIVGTLVFLFLLDFVFEFLRWTEDKRIRRLWNCAREGSIPSWFSSALLVFTGVTFFAAFFLSRKRGAKGRTPVAWSLIACFFLFMGIDDAAEIHEKLGPWLRDQVEDAAGESGLLRVILELPIYSWQLFLGPIFGAMGIFILVFLWGHFGRHGLRHYMLLGLGCYAVAVGFDALERIDGLFEDVGQAWGWRTHKVSHMSKVVEELLEMFGTACFLIGALRYFVAEADGLSFTLGRPAKS